MNAHGAHRGAPAASALRLPDWLARRAANGPNIPALIATDAQWTFAELDGWVTRVARRLDELGVRPGDRVALLLRNSPEFVAVVHAAPRVGAVLVPLNTRLAASEIAWQIRDVEARLLLYDAHHTRLVETVQRVVPELSVVGIGWQGDGLGDWSSSPGLEHPIPDTDIDLSAVHTIIYTSGTTGRPKGAMLTYGNHWWSAMGSALNLGIHHDDRWLAVLPLFHVGGLAILMRCVIYGIAAVVHEAFDPGAVNRSIDEDGVTIVSVVSAMLQRMLDERGERPYPATLRCVLLGGGPAPKPLLDACADRHIPVVQTYGLTETTSQVATLSPADALRKLGSAGKPLLPTELWIDRDGAPAPPGEVGEILTRGPTVTIGYVNRPEETARAIRDGWLHTGDLGYLDSEGYLYVIDRRNDLIVSGGENVYPAEVEATLLAHPAVEEAGVVGVADRRWGQVPVAVVKVRLGSTLGEAELLAFCAERLARYKIPTRVRFVDELPRNATGKLLRSVLREQAASNGMG